VLGALPELPSTTTNGANPPMGWKQLEQIRGARDDAAVRDADAMATTE